MSRRKRHQPATPEQDAQIRGVLDAVGEALAADTPAARNAARRRMNNRLGRMLDPDNLSLLSAAELAERLRAPADPRLQQKADYDVTPEIENHG